MIWHKLAAEDAAGSYETRSGGVRLYGGAGNASPARGVA